MVKYGPTRIKSPKGINRVVRTLEKWNSRRFPGFPGDFCTKFQVNFPRQPKSQLMKKSAAGENFDEKCRRQKILSKRVPCGDKFSNF